MHTAFPAYRYPIDEPPFDDPCDPSYLANRHPQDGRPSLPRLLTVEDDAGGPLDRDQKASELFLSPFSTGAASHIVPASAPEPLAFSPASQDADLSSSPAAMFLSSFSPVAPTISFAPDDEGQLVAGYTLGPVIARGGFSTIRRAHSAATGATVAVKIVRRADLVAQPAVRDKLAHEAAVWAGLTHEHILPLFSAVHTAFADFFVMPLCPAGSLFDMLAREGTPALPPDDAGMLFRQVVRGLRYLHEAAGYVHRDLKLENVLVDESGVCRIADFGMARRIGETDVDAAGAGELASSQSMFLPPAAAATLRRQSTTAPRALRERLQQRESYASRRKASNPLPATHTPRAAHEQAFEAGSLPYAAPELLMPHERALPADPAQDMWALGVMLYALLVGRLPFMDPFEPRLQMKIVHGEICTSDPDDRPLTHHSPGVYERVPSIGTEAERVIDGCLERNVEDRWTVAMVDDVAWGVGWNTVIEPPYEPEPERRSRHPSRGERAARRSLSRCALASRSCSRERPPSLSPERRRRTPPDSLGPTRTSLSRTRTAVPPPTVLSPTASLTSTASSALSASVERAHARQRSESRSPLPPTPTDGAVPLPPVERGRKGFGAAPSPLVRELELGIREEDEDADALGPIDAFALPPKAVVVDLPAAAAAVPVERGRQRRPAARASTSVSVPARQARGRSSVSRGPGDASAPWLMGNSAGWNPSPSRPAPPLAWTLSDDAAPRPVDLKAGLRSRSVGFELRRANSDSATCEL
jgi:serine/threonine protein kinase